uniref:Uncharacterized protein n=1 Tax=Sander lucioperca TaxID=283035 RepID=A0A8D0B335_SANLU
MSASYPTPVYWHAGRGGFREVYEPAEDSFLLVDAQEKDTDRLHPCVCLEKASGSGVLSAFLASVVGPSALSLSVCVLLYQILTLIFSGVQILICTFDQCVLFFQVGREVTNRLLPVVAQLLSSEGLFYLITIAENDPGEYSDASEMTPFYPSLSFSAHDLRTPGPIKSNTKSGIGRG